MRYHVRKARDFTKRKDVAVVAHTWVHEGLKIAILSVGGRHYCTYIGIPIDHPIAGYDYNDIPLDCHGSLTYAAAGNGDPLDKNYYWYGWDYAHSGDYIWFHDGALRSKNDKDWNLGEVERDAWGAIYDFKTLCRLAEKIYNNTTAYVLEKQEKPQ
jgi:hypothetical protein